MITAVAAAIGCFILGLAFENGRLAWASFAVIAILLFVRFLP